MHKQTYKRHYDILTWIENEYHKQLKQLVTYSTKQHVKGVLKAIGDIKSHLEDFTDHLSQLRKNEKELIKMLQDFYGLNKRIDIQYIIEEMKGK